MAHFIPVARALAAPPNTNNVTMHERKREGKNEMLVFTSHQNKLVYVCIGTRSITSIKSVQRRRGGESNDSEKSRLT